GAAQPRGHGRRSQVGHAHPSTRAADRGPARAHLQREDAPCAGRRGRPGEALGAATEVRRHDGQAVARRADAAPAARFRRALQRAALRAQLADGDPAADAGEEAPLRPSEREGDPVKEPFVAHWGGGWGTAPIVCATGAYNSLGLDPHQIWAFRRAELTAFSES